MRKEMFYNSYWNFKLYLYILYLYYLSFKFIPINKINKMQFIARDLQIFNYNEKVLFLFELLYMIFKFIFYFIFDFNMYRL